MSAPRSPSSITLDPPDELYDALNRGLPTYDADGFPTGVYSGNASFGTYVHQPTLCRLEDGSYLAAYRMGTGHSQPPDYIALLRSPDGFAWGDRRSEQVVCTPTSTQQVAAVSRVGSRIWLLGVDAITNDPGTYPSRRSWTKYTDDPTGRTGWTEKSYNIPVLGTLHTTFGLARGVFNDPFHPGDLFCAGYYRDFKPGTMIQETRYTAVLLKSSDNGSTWAVQGTIARDPGTPADPGAGRQFEEPFCIFVGDIDGHMQCLSRVDKGSQIPHENEKIYLHESFDHGATWSAPVIAFPGRGTTSFLKTKGGVWVACTRSPGPEPSVSHVRLHGLRGVLMMSDNFQTWRPWTTVPNPTLEAPDGEFQVPQAATWNPVTGVWDPVVPFDGLFDGGMYTGGDLIELADPDHIGILSSQDPIAEDNGRSGLQWRRGIVKPSTPLYEAHFRSLSALEFPQTGVNYLDYGAQPLLNGADEWTACFRLRYKANSDGGWTTVERTLLSLRSLSPAQGQLMISLVPNRSLLISVANTFTSWSFHQTPTNDPLLVNNAWVEGVIAFKSGVLMVWFDGVGRPLTSSGAALPAVMTSPTVARATLGSTLGSNPLRSTQVDEVGLWVGPGKAITTAEGARALGSLGDKTLSALGSPHVWLRFEESTFSDSMGLWAPPTVVGAPILVRRSGAARAWRE